MDAQFEQVAQETSATLTTETVATVSLPKKPRVWTTFATWIAAAIAGQFAVIVGFVAVGVVVGASMGAQGADPATIQKAVQETIQQPLPLLLLSLVPFQLGMLAVVLLAARSSRETLIERLHLNQPKNKPGMLRLLSTASFTLSAALGLAVLLSLLLGVPGASPIGTAVQDGSWLVVAVVSVLLSTVPAVVEELLFRGYIQGRLLKRWSPTAAISVSTLLFAIMHADSLHHIAAVVPLGVVLGILAYRTGSIRSGMIVHAVHNAAAVAFAAAVRLLGSYANEEVVGMSVVAAILALAICGVPGLVALARKGTNAADENPAPSVALAAAA
jgi:uncharacterized protein